MKKSMVVFFIAALAAGVLSLVGSGPAAAATEFTPQFTGQVVVGQDGNGVTAATFQTTVAPGLNTHYYLFTQPVPNVVTPKALQVTLNAAIVLQITMPSQFGKKGRVEVALNDPAGAANQITVSATGDPGASAFITVVALSETPPITVGALAGNCHAGSALDQTYLSILNAGNTAALYRISFYKFDGTLIGITPVGPLAAHATNYLSVYDLFINLGFDSTNLGSFRVVWSSVGPNGAVVGEIIRAHLILQPDGTTTIHSVTRTPMHDLGKRTLSISEAPTE